MITGTYGITTVDRGFRLPPRFQSLAKTLSVGGLVDGEWLYSADEVALVKAEAARRQEAARRSRTGAKADRRDSRPPGSAATRRTPADEALVERLKAEWKRIVATGDADAVVAYADRIASRPPRLSDGSFAFAMDPIADRRVLAAVMVARDAVLAGEDFDSACWAAARRFRCEAREVKHFVGQAGGRGRLTPRRK